MAGTIPLTQKEQDLIRRYLVWWYRTTKEDLDQTDRYFTQAVVDDYLIERLKTSPEYKARTTPFHKSVEDFIQYAREKKAKAERKKFADSAQKTLHPDYKYLKARFEVVEQAICHFFDQKELERVAALYENEMTERILKAREHT
ncbi:MAG: hypothetical protein HY210_02270 [Candidatus Omnitrophica bacterium]|nr:hypothetical protein [Candidatus Omnitrophota bacterium]